MRILIFLLFTTILIACNQNAPVNSSNTADDRNDTASERLQVGRAEEAMFNAIRTNDPGFWERVSDSYITINADGVMANKTETIQDSLRRKMFIGIDHKLLDHHIKVFGNVGICNGRAQFFMQDKMVAEVYYTAIFRRENGNWIYENWQGTMTKNSPK